MDIIGVEDIFIYAIIGINADEQINKQEILISFEIYTDTSKTLLNDSITECYNYATIKKFIVKYVSGTKFLTLEALANNLK